MLIAITLLLFLPIATYGWNEAGDMVIAAN